MTGAGAVLLTLQPPVPPQARVTRVCMGRVVDLGVNDANNMGAAMAPAAAGTLLALLAPPVRRANSSRRRSGVSRSTAV